MVAARVPVKGIFNGVLAWHRPGTRDERYLSEVIVKRAYARPKLGFDVEPGEKWLDLGAGIGEFGLYALSRGAVTVESYEPDLDAYRVLCRNMRTPHLNTHATVTHTGSKTTHLGTYNYPGRGGVGTAVNTVVPRKRGYDTVQLVPNVWVKAIKNRFDGIKMDIEGAEHAILDASYIPPCRKLVMEYHTSVDSSMANFQERMNWLRELFDHVVYPLEFERAIVAGKKHFKPFYDRTIFAWKEGK